MQKQTCSCYDNGYKSWLANLLTLGGLEPLQYTICNLKGQITKAMIKSLTAAPPRRLPNLIVEA